jgi:hypothetical protein
MTVARSARALRRALALAGIALLLAAIDPVLAGAVAAAAEPWVALKSVRRVAVDVAFDPDHPRVAPGELERRLEEALRQAAPAPRVDQQSPDVLRLTVSVRQISANDLRGFYLPFSGAYGIGVVRLALERQVTVPGLPQSMPAVVWQAERVARAGWLQSGQEVIAHLDELAGIFLEDFRRAAGGP